MTSSDGLYFQEEGGEMVLRGVEELDRHPPHSQAWRAWGVRRKIGFTYRQALVRAAEENLQRRGEEGSRVSSDDRS